MSRLTRALSEFRLEGVATNIAFLRNILAHPDFAAGHVHTRWLDEHIATLAADGPSSASASWRRRRPRGAAMAGLAGAQVKSRDPLALFAHDAAVKAEQAHGRRRRGRGRDRSTGPDGSVGVASPIQGTIVAINVAEGDEVRQGQQVAVVEAMKMEHVITAPHARHRARRHHARRATWCAKAFRSSSSRRPRSRAARSPRRQELDPITSATTCARTSSATRSTLDENRPEAVARRRKTGYTMPRENIDRLVDPGSFNEYWPLVVARQHQRNTMDELRKNTPGDGVVAGMCIHQRHLFDETRSRAALVHYDYTVLAGTQGHRNHYKQDRMFELAHRFRLPMILFGEGGGGRPGDDDTGPRVAIDTQHLHDLLAAQRAGADGLGRQRPHVSPATPRWSPARDVIIATEGSTLGMGGPAMIEGGGLGIYTPEEVGPMSFQVPNGVVDILVKDEFAAVDTVKKYLSYFQGAMSDLGGARPAHAAVRRAGEPPAALRHARRSCTRSRTRTPCWRSARSSASASSPPSSASRAGRWA